MQALTGEKIATRINGRQTLQPMQFAEEVLGFEDHRQARNNPFSDRDSFASTGLYWEVYILEGISDVNDFLRPFRVSTKVLHYMTGRFPQMLYKYQGYLCKAHWMTKNGLFLWFLWILFLDPLFASWKIAHTSAVMKGLWWWPPLGGYGPPHAFCRMHTFRTGTFWSFIMIKDGQVEHRNIYSSVFIPTRNNDFFLRGFYHFPMWVVLGSMIRFAVFSFRV